MRTNKIDVTKILGNLTTDPKICNALYKFLANNVLKANSISSVGWALYEIDGNIAFSIRNVYTISIHINGQEIKEIEVLVAESHLDNQLKGQLKRLGCTISGGFKNTGGSQIVKIPCETAENFIQAVGLIQPAIEKYISNVLKPGTKAIRTLYNPKITRFLESQVGTKIPDPEYYPSSTGTDKPGKDSDQPKSIFEIIDSYLKSKGFYFTSTQIASFYTALQTKGFVLLSGISGTGKTKLAQLFAEMLPVPIQKTVKELDDVISITLQPDHIKRHRLVLQRKVS